MASIAKVDVEVHLKAINDSPELQNLLRQFIREELANPETAKALMKLIAEEYEKKS